MRKLADKAGGGIDLVLDEITVGVALRESTDCNGRAMEPA